MKRIKTILAAVTVLAVVGGALAFKAHSTYGTGNIYTDNGQGQCNSLDPNKLAGASTLIISGTTTSTTSPCPGTINYRVVQ